MNEELLAQIVNNMRMNQPQGPVGNVSDTEMSMFSGNPMNGAVAGGNVGNVTNNEVARFIANPVDNTNAIASMRAANNTGGAVGNTSDTEASLFNMVAGGVSNPMPRINEMRNNLATAGSAGSVGNASNTEANIFRGQTNEEINEMQVARANLSRLKEIGQTRILTDDEKYQANKLQMYMQKMLPPVEVMPPDIDNLNLSPEALRELLKVIENPNFRGFPMRGGR